MIEKVVLDYLESQHLDAYMEMPESTPSYPFVILEKTGSSVDNYLTTSTIAIQSYGSSMYSASSLNEAVKQLMDGAIACEEITKVKLDSDYNFTDTTTKRYRYQAVFDITHY